jgi:hypothetical protein
MSSNGLIMNFHEDYDPSNYLGSYLVLSPHFLSGARPCTMIPLFLS